MEGSFDRWCDSLSFDGRKSVVFSDNDDDTENAAQVIVIDSSDISLNVSADLTLKKLPLSKNSSISERAIKSKRKNIMFSEYSGDAKNSNDKDVKIVSPDDCKRDSTSDSASKGETKEGLVESRVKAEEMNKSPLIAQSKNIQDPVDDTSTNMYTSAGRTEDQHTFPMDSNVKLAISPAYQEIEVGNIDPMSGIKNVLLLCKMMENLLYEMDRTMLQLKMDTNKGDKLHRSMGFLKKNLEDIAAEIERTTSTEPVNTELHSATELNTGNFDPYSKIDNVSIKSHASPNGKAFGEKTPTALEKEQALIVDRLQDSYLSLLHIPFKEVKAEDPQGLTVKLASHQQHALAWLMWREEQKPAGGVLADGIGLGKTLTMISLIIATIAKNNKSREWIDSKTPLQHKGGTLVVCPTFLLSKWEEEIENRCNRGMLSVLVHHGSKREKVPKRLANYDVVITTYNILISEFKAKSVLYQIHWERLTLDKAHIILEFQNQASDSVSRLIASKRWAIIDTSIPNIPMGFYPILKFLQFSPLDDLQVWDHWLGNRKAAGQQYLMTLMPNLMLRRTKEELETIGELECFPAKLVEEVVVNLDSQENLFYQKGFRYARRAVARFLTQQAEKDRQTEIDRSTHSTGMHTKFLSSYFDVKARETSVVLLRLRQFCDHPSLIYSVLDQEFMKRRGITESENLDRNLLSHINGRTTTNEQEIGIDSKVDSNSVCRPDRISSKLKMVLDTVKEILRKKDKLIIVSEWPSMLEIVASHLPSIKGATFRTIRRKAPIKEKQSIIDSFNAVDRNPQILLLSITPGSVGLNLVGGNHLLLIDIHWNPLLEVHAQDWIYRMGQKKNIFVYKFICKDTIEQRIQILQNKRLETVRNDLRDEKNFAAAQLTFGDLISLFVL